MRQISLRNRFDVGQIGAMTGQHGSPAEPAQSLQRIQIVGQAAVFVVDDGRSTAQHGVRGQHRVVENEGQRIGGVAGCCPDRDPHARSVDHLAVDEFAGQAAQKSAARRAHRRTGQIDQLVDGVGVVAVPVADQHQSDVADAGDGRDVLVVIGSGIDNDDLVAAGGRVAPRCWCRPVSSGPGCWRVAPMRCP